MITVKATREGLGGAKTSTGYKVEGDVPFVALPSTAALRQWVKVYNPATQKQVRALVLDVGPWNEEDHAYVFQPLTLLRMGVPPLSLLWTVKDELAKGVRPQSESKIDSFGRATNGAGIDLGEAVWAALGMTDNSSVSWEFE